VVGRRALSACMQWCKVLTHAHTHTQGIHVLLVLPESTRQFLGRLRA